MKVKIKTWERMEKEYGVYDVGVINCTGRYVDSMEKEMPPDRIIDVVDDHWNYWEITGDMVEYVIADMEKAK